MKYIKIAIFLLFTNICIGSFLKSLNANKEIINLFYMVILAYVILLGLAGVVLLFQIVLLTIQLQHKEKEIRARVNELRLKKKMNIISFYKEMIKILDLNLIQKEIVKILLKLGISFKLLKKN